VHHVSTRVAIVHVCMLHAQIDSSPWLKEIVPHASWLIVKPSGDRN